MKKFKLPTVPAIVAILLLAVVFISCEDQVFKNSNKAISDQWEVRKKSKNVNGYYISIIEFDSCQYLISGTGYSQMMTHKGNCKYCRERILNNR